MLNPDQKLEQQQDPMNGLNDMFFLLMIYVLEAKQNIFLFYFLSYTIYLINPSKSMMIRSWWNCITY